MADFTHLPTHCKFVALMPQWDFLNFLAEQGKRYKTFDLRMNAEATDLIEEGGRVVGLRAKTPDGALAIRAASSSAATAGIRRCATRPASSVDDYGAPMDVLWFRLSRKATDDSETFGHIEAGKMMVMLDRGDYWQCAFVIPKGGIEQVKARGLEAFRRDVAWMSPFLADRVGELKSWDDIKLLTVTVDRLRQWWRPGLICIGDAAHAMSPIGGVGVNLAVQDAVAAANRLAAPLRRGQVSDADLQRHPGAPHARGALHPMAAADGAEAGRQPRAERRAAAEAAAHIQAAEDFPGAAAHPGAPARSRHPPRAYSHAGGGAGYVG